MADDQQMVKMAAVGQRWDKLADAAGKILKAFAVGGGRMLPVGTPGGIVFRIFSLEVAMMTHYLTAIPKRELGRPVGSLADQQDDITRALAVLITGF